MQGEVRTNEVFVGAVMTQLNAAWAEMSRLSCHAAALETFEKMLAIKDSQPEMPVTEWEIAEHAWLLWQAGMHRKGVLELSRIDDQDAKGKACVIMGRMNRELNDLEAAEYCYRLALRFNCVVVRRTVLPHVADAVRGGEGSSDNFPDTSLPQVYATAAEYASDWGERLNYGRAISNLVMVTREAGSGATHLDVTLRILIGFLVKLSS